MRNFILKDENAVFYECGYSCDNEIYISICGENFFITDARYSIEARQNIKNAQVIEIQSSLIKEARLLLRKLGVKIYTSTQMILLLCNIALLARI